MNPFPRHKTNRNPYARPRVVEADESENEDVLSKTLLAVQQLSGNSRLSSKKPHPKKPLVWEREMPIEVVEQLPRCVPVSKQASENNTEALVVSIKEIASTHPKLPDSSDRPADALPRSNEDQAMQFLIPKKENTMLYRPHHTKPFSPAKRAQVPPKHEPEKAPERKSVVVPPGVGRRFGPWVDGREIAFQKAREETPGVKFLFIPGDVGWGGGYWMEIPPAKKQTRRKRSKKAKVTFLSLPGELRNQIYEQVMPECRILIQRTRPNKELESLKTTWSTALDKHKRPRTRLFHFVANDQMDQGLQLTMSLLLACKDVRNDIEQYLYSRTTFCFDSLKVLNFFLGTASKQGLQAVRKLELSYEGYGNPELTDNVQFRERYYEGWSTTCVKLGQQLASLSDLKIDARLHDWPYDMSKSGLVAMWEKTVVRMAPRRLPRVKVTLHHRMFHCNSRAMKDLAHSVEDLMLTQEGREERDLIETRMVLARLEAKRVAREARLEAKKVAKEAKRKAEEAKEKTKEEAEKKATKIEAKAKEAKMNAPTEMTITIDQIKQQKPVAVKVRHKGLDKYTRLEPLNMCVAELYMFQQEYCSERHKK